MVQANERSKRPIVNNVNKQMESCENQGGGRVKNKAGYMATPISRGWVGAIFEVSWSFEPEQWDQKHQKPKKKVKCDGWTDGRMDGQTDGPMDQQTDRQSLVFSRVAFH